MIISKNSYHSSQKQNLWSLMLLGDGEKVVTSMTSRSWKYGTIFVG
jgi:hypothetical protein